MLQEMPSIPVPALVTPAVICCMSVIPRLLERSHSSMKRQRRKHRPFGTAMNEWRKADGGELHRKRRELEGGHPAAGRGFTRGAFSTHNAAFQDRGERTMARVPVTIAAAAALALAATTAAAQEKVRVGVLVTLSGPPAILGQQIRNGFQLAVKNLEGKLGGREVELIVADDELKPDVAVSKARALVERDKAAFVVGLVFSNIQ